MRRREVIRGALAGAATGPWFLRRTSAQEGWGRLRDDPWAGPSPIKRVLEIFIYGGLSPWETFYLNPKTGRAPTAGKLCTPAAACPAATTDTGEGLQWSTFQCEFEDLFRRSGAPAGMSPTFEFSSGIHLGPATRPLWRDDLVKRMRILVSSHDLLPHEAAIPFCLTGTRLGRPTMAGTGAAVERRYSVGGEPVAFVVKPTGDTPSDNIASVLSVGEHPASTRPLMLEVPCGGPNLEVLNRQATPAEDDLLKFYRAQYRSRITRPGTTGPIRNRSFNEYVAMTESFFNTGNIQRALDGFDRKDPLLDGTDPSCTTTQTPRCGNDPFGNDRVRQALDFGAFLLRRPQTRYVCVVDVGRQASGMAGYDTHGADHAVTIFRNLSSTLGLLARLMDPGPNNSPRIPADTLVVITTEFGRSPDQEGKGGRKHWPHSYAQVLLPPAHPKLKGGKFVGGIDEKARIFVPAGTTVGAITPTDLRAALLVALEIEPFDRGNFGVGGLSAEIGKGTESSGRVQLVKEVLGYDI